MFRHRISKSHVRWYGEAILCIVNDDTQLVIWAAYFQPRGEPFGHRSVEWKFRRGSRLRSGQITSKVLGGEMIYLIHRRRGPPPAQCQRLATRGTICATVGSLKLSEMNIGMNLHQWRNKESKPSYQNMQKWTVSGPVKIDASGAPLAQRESRI